MPIAHNEELRVLMRHWKGFLNEKDYNGSVKWNWYRAPSETPLMPIQSCPEVTARGWGSFQYAHMSGCLCKHHREGGLEAWSSRDPTRLSR